MAPPGLCAPHAIAYDPAERPIGAADPPLDRFAKDSMRRFPRTCWLRRAVLGLVLLLAQLLPARADRLLVEAMEYPWSAIGRVNADGQAFCTGFLIGERHALTAAHCLYNRRQGRWWKPSELHFIAGYQRGAHLLPARLRRYEISPHFVPQAGMALDAIVQDWAMLELDRPIGRAAGWLGLAPLTPELLARITSGEGRVVQAGYRRDRPHAITLDLSCGVSGLYHDGMVLVHSCDVQEGASGSPLLLAMDGALRVIGMHVARGSVQHTNFGGALSTPVFQPRIGPQYAVNALRAAGPVWGSGAAPAAGSPARAVPGDTVAHLLQRIGFLPSALGEIEPTRRAQAIRLFERQHALPPTGLPSLPLLTDLIRVAP